MSKDGQQDRYAVGRWQHTSSLDDPINASLSNDGATLAQRLGNISGVLSPFSASNTVPHVVPPRHYTADTNSNGGSGHQHLGGDEDNADDGHEEASVSTQRSHGGLTKKLGCPLYKFDTQGHPKCANRSFWGCTQVRNHLKIDHHVPYAHCRPCDLDFPTAKLYKHHLEENPNCKRQPEGPWVQTLKFLNDRSKGFKFNTEEQRWEALFAGLFPQCVEVPSPYALDHEMTPQQKRRLSNIPAKHLDIMIEELSLDLSPSRKMSLLARLQDASRDDFAQAGISFEGLPEPDEPVTTSTIKDSDHPDILVTTDEDQMGDQSMMSDHLSYNAARPMAGQMLYSASAPDLERPDLSIADSHSAVDTFTIGTQTSYNDSIMTETTSLDEFFDFQKYCPDLSLPVNNHGELERKEQQQSYIRDDLSFRTI